MKLFDESKFLFHIDYPDVKKVDVVCPELKLSIHPSPARGLGSADQRPAAMYSSQVFHGALRSAFENTAISQMGQVAQSAAS
jgi:hypothetical protein